MSDRHTQYGFTWGPVIVERMTHIEGRGRVLGIRTDKGAQLQVLISEAGHKITPYPMPKRPKAHRAA